MNRFTTMLTVDRRGRFYADGLLVGFEDEVETFKQLAKKYLVRELREVLLLTDPPQIRFDVEQSNRNVAA